MLDSEDSRMKSLTFSEKNYTIMMVDIEDLRIFFLSHSDMGNRLKHHTHRMLDIEDLRIFEKISENTTPSGCWILRI